MTRDIAGMLHAKNPPFKFHHGNFALYFNPYLKPLSKVRREPQPLKSPSFAFLLAQNEVALLRTVKLHRKTAGVSFARCLFAVAAAFVVVAAVEEIPEEEVVVVLEEEVDEVVAVEDSEEAVLVDEEDMTRVPLNLSPVRTIIHC